jgi:protein ImuB
MLAQLAADLERRQCQVQSFTLVIEHRREPPTAERFELVAADHRRERFANLAAARLERVALRAPAVAVRLESGPYRPLELDEPDLFASGRRRGTQDELLERLRERLGAAAVFGVQLVADHRPELAWGERADLAVHHADRTARAAQPAPPATAWLQRRPLWMLPKPLPLQSPAARAYCDGSVRLVAGPERIESGWWDERDVCRDYYTASSSSGRELWVYRDRASREWHLHGLFG